MGIIGAATSQLGSRASRPTSQIRWLKWNSGVPQGSSLVSYFKFPVQGNPIRSWRSFRFLSGIKHRLRHSRLVTWTRLLPKNSPSGLIGLTNINKRRSLIFLRYSFFCVLILILAIWLIVRGELNYRGGWGKDSLSLLCNHFCFISSLRFYCVYLFPFVLGFQMRLYYFFIFCLTTKTALTFPIFTERQKLTRNYFFFNIPQKNINLIKVATTSIKLHIFTIVMENQKKSTWGEIRSSRFKPTINH